MITSGDPRNIEAASIIYESQLLDITTKIDPFSLEVLTMVSKIADTLKMVCLVIGASAKDYKHGRNL